MIKLEYKIHHKSWNWNYYGYSISGTIGSETLDEEPVEMFFGRIVSFYPQDGVNLSYGYPNHTYAVELHGIDISHLSVGDYIGVIRTNHQFKPSDDKKTTDKREFLIMLSLKDYDDLIFRKVEEIEVPEGQYHFSTPTPEVHNTR